MGICQEPWQAAVLSEARGAEAPAGREPTLWPQTPEQPKVDGLKEHSAGVGRELWVNVYRAENWTWGTSAPLLVWAYWEGPGCPAKPYPSPSDKPGVPGPHSLLTVVQKVWGKYGDLLH